MIDFTSSLYLAMKHESAELLKWSQLTTGVPAALYEPKQSKKISLTIAQMQGLEMGCLAPSTLHLYWGLYGFLSNQKITVFIDEKAYPVSRYGVERLSVKKVPVYLFNHLNANHLAELIKGKLQKYSTPIVITDGWCTQCGQIAPIEDYAKLVSPLGGNIIIDDTQAFGILGEKITNAMYGNGGGGTLKWLNVSNPCIISIISLAKGFGVPMAVLSGNKTFISQLIENSETRVTSSPVSIAHICAGINALSINCASGDQRRRKLLTNVFLLKKAISQSGIQLRGGIFPVQCTCNLKPDKSRKLFEKLKTNGIKTVLVSGHDTSCPVLCFLINCNNEEEEFQVLLSTLQKNTSVLT